MDARLASCFSHFIAEKWASSIDWRPRSMILVEEKHVLSHSTGSHWNNPACDYRVQYGYILKTVSVLKSLIFCIVHRRSLFGIATRYGLDSPGIEFRWGQDFSHQSRPALGPIKPLVRGVKGSFSLQKKQPGRGVNHSPPYSAEVIERVELYVYFLSGPSWSLLGGTLPLILLFRLFNYLWSTK